MKKIRTIELVEQLADDTRKVILEANRLLQTDPGILTEQPAEDKWSVVQVFEHLNSYGRYYLPELESAIMNSRHKPEEWYTAGWLGDYFTRSMLPSSKGTVTNKMKSPRDHRPKVDLDSKPVIDEFLHQQQRLLSLLEKAKSVNISKARVPISLTRLIKLKVGDTFRFLIAHEQRHFVQVQKTLNEVFAQSRKAAKDLC